jgi:hypothetical protein
VCKEGRFQAPSLLVEKGFRDESKELLPAPASCLLLSYLYLNISSQNYQISLRKALFSKYYLAAP